MPRRRMIDPFFYNDPKVGKVSRDERSLIVGCICQADDDGRLQGDPAFLKSQIFKYDKDLDDAAVQTLRDSFLAQMKSWPVNHPYRILLYSNSGEEYIFFPNWAATNKPSHPTKSQLPPPPPESLPIFSGAPQESVEKSAREAPEPLAPRSGQSSQGKVSIGQVSAVQEDFAKSLDSDIELTDLLTTTLTKTISAGRAAAQTSLGAEALSPEQESTIKSQWGIQALKKCWQDGVGGDMPQAIFEGASKALKQYPLKVVAKAFAKGVRYKGGKHKSWKYFQTIIDEEMERTRAP